MNDNERTLVGLLLDDEEQLSITDLCRVSHLPEATIIEYVEYGVIEPLDMRASHWNFHGSNLRRVKTAARLHHDLGINAAGIALVLELMEELTTLRRNY